MDKYPGDAAREDGEDVFEHAIEPVSGPRVSLSSGREFGEL